MRTDFLKTALKIVEVKSFSVAAYELFMTQPSVSNQIRCLEKEIGFKLFEHGSFFGRNKLPILTEAGAVYLFWASQALAMLEEGILEAKEQP